MRKLLLAGLVSGGVIAYRRLRGQSTTPSYPEAPHLHPVPTGDAVLPGDDQGGSSPDEAAADLASEAETHAVTLPDQPLEEVDLTEVPDPEVPARD